MFTQISRLVIALQLFTGAALAAGDVTSSALAGRWQIGEPVVTYWAGPGDTMPVTSQTAEQLVAGGWNLAWTRNPADLDLYHSYGLRVMLEVGLPNLDDAAQLQKLDALVDAVSTHPALYSYYLMDEPGAGGFPQLARIAAHLRKRDPAHLAYINLLPTYATEAQLGVSADKAERAKVGYPTNFAGVGADDQTVLRYREYLKRFVETVQPGLISYDHYHFLRDGDGAQYFLNLALIRLAAKEAGIPFLNIIQACNSPAEGWREPGINEVRWLTYTSLAYGAQGLAHFRYDTGLWDKPGVMPRPLFWALCAINREFVARARELQPLQSLDVYHSGGLPLGAKALPADCPFRPSRADQPLLLGLFGPSPDRSTHVVVVNLDYRHSSTVHLQAPAPLELFHPATRTWTTPPADSGSPRLELPPGGGALLRLGRK